MRTALIRKENNSRRKAVSPLFPKHTSQQVVGHVAGLVAKGNTDHATKMVRNATRCNQPDAESLVQSVVVGIEEWAAAYYKTY